MDSVRTGPFVSRQVRWQAGSDRFVGFAGVTRHGVWASQGPQREISYSNSPASWKLYNFGRVEETMAAGEVKVRVALRGKTVFAVQ